MAEQDLDRNQAATPYKLEKARERGQAARSADVTSAVVFTAAMTFLAWQGWDAWRRVFGLADATLAQAGRIDASPVALWTLVEQVVRSALVLAAPFFLTLVIAAVAGNVVQTGGPLLSVDPLKPDWSRVNPAQGLKNLLTTRTLFNAARAAAKLLLLGAVVYAALKALVPRFGLYASLPPAGVARSILADLATLGLKVAAVLCLVALVDAIYTRRAFAKQMRMSRRELKDELRHREGDPGIRARLRELRRELLKRTLSLRKTRTADVLVTNPTHVAVALRYAHGEMEAPQMVAKGAGVLAAAMRGIAARHRIPVVQNPPLARALFHRLPIDRHVPPDLYADVARIIVWVFAMRDAQARRAAAVPAAPGGTAWIS